MLFIKTGRAFSVTIIVASCLIGQAIAQSSKLDSLFDNAKRLRIAGEMTKAIAQYRECLALAQKNNDSLKIGNAYIGVGIVEVYDVDP